MYSGDYYEDNSSRIRTNPGVTSRRQISIRPRSLSSSNQLRSNGRLLSTGPRQCTSTRVPAFYIMLYATSLSLFISPFGCTLPGHTGQQSAHQHNSNCRHGRLESGIGTEREVFVVCQTSPRESIYIGKVSAITDHSQSQVGQEQIVSVIF